MKNKKDKEKLYQVIPKDMILDPEVVNAYYMADGKCESIINPEDHLINAGAIDEVSENIAIQFDQLLDIEFDK